uniref:serine hydrolase n=1 Tax=Thaumasiovibrio occultus TaxID=1891184 RepID=UPI000B362495|nr:serine hydrolase [Thaumasiovibrio occultus]
MFKSALRIIPALYFVSFGLAAITPDAPSVNAKGYILMDYHSGHVIAESKSNVRLNPASLTKVMTSYVIGQEIELGNISLDDDVVISENAWARNFPDSSKMFIEVGTTVKAADLNRGIIIQSGNDACVAMAEHVAGSTDAFVQLMNSWAANLGMTNTHFTNPHGLDDDNLYSTPYDMAILTQALIRDVPSEFEVYSEKSFTYNGITQYNRNSLLWDESMNVDGLKTGHTSKAGYSLISTATQGDMRLIAVVMGTESMEARKQESKRLLTYGFRFFDTVSPNKAGDILANERVWLGLTESVDLGITEDVFLTLPRADVAKLEASFTINSALEAPLSKGQEVGSLEYKVGDEVVATYPLVTMEEVEQGSWFSRLVDRIKMFFMNLIG